MKGQSERSRSRSRVVQRADIRAGASRDNGERLHLVLPKAQEPVVPTHWAFSQLAPRDSPTGQEPTGDSEDTVTEALRDLARWLYQQLEAEHDHLTSDDAIEDGIVANEYTFTAGGQRFGN